MGKNLKPDLTAEQKEAKRLEAEAYQLRLKDHADRHNGQLPKTRREFLGSGLALGTSTLFLPTMLQLIASEARATEMSQECVGLLSPSGSWIPYIQVHFGGGAALHASIMPTDVNRNPLPSYASLGLGTTANFNMVKAFGNQVPLAQKNSQYIGQVMAGLTSVATPATLMKGSLVKFCVLSQDDRIGPDGIMGLVMAAGRRGLDLPALSTPATQKTAAIIRPAALQGIGNVDAFKSALQPQEALTAYIKNPSQRTTLFRLLRDLNQSQRKNLDQTATAQTLGQLAECTGGKNIDMLSVDTSQYDARTNSTVSGIWGISPSTAGNDPSTLQATCVMNALSGKAAGARIDLTLYDYHGQTRTAQNALDLAGGKVLGNILKTADALGSPVFLHVTSDGSVETNSSGSDSNYSADAGARGSGFFIVFDPKNGAPPTTDNQIGQFNAAQASDQAWMNSWTNDRCGLAVFANYLQYHKQLGMLQSIAPNQYSAADLQKLVKLA